MAGFFYGHARTDKGLAFVRPCSNNGLARHFVYRLRPMKISRETNLLLNHLLNEWVPPWIRDRRWFGWLVTKALYRENAPLYMNFHERVYDMTDEEFRTVYAQIQSTALDRETDLNRACTELVLKNAQGTVLEVGCGRGYLCGLLAQKHAVTGCDVALSPAVKDRHHAITFVEAPAESLPFEDASFDTVVSTHMLEHVRDLPRVLAELRRVARGRLIIVVPCERPHFYTPNLHLHFFPYRYSVQLAFRPPGEYLLEKAGGDWYYQEER